jgi:hypothetical protein
MLALVPARRPAAPELEGSKRLLASDGMPIAAISIVGCCAVLAFDAAAALASRRFGFSYGLLAPGSLLLYAATGYLAGKQATSLFVVGAAAGAAVAATEATLGWRISRALGIEDNVSPRMETGVAIVVTLTGALLGGVAGALS